MTKTRDKYETLARELFTKLTMLDIGRYDVYAATTINQCRQLCQEMMHLCATEERPILAQEKKEKTTKKVLLIDTDEDVHRLVKFALRKSGFLVKIEKSPTMALQRMLEIKPDLVLLEIMMPEMTGFQLLHRLHQHPDRPNFRIVVASSRSYDRDRVAVLEAGADDYIAKPFQIEELVLRLQRLLA